MIRRFITLPLAAALVFSSPAHAADCLDEIASALRAQDWSRAVELARAHRARAECATDADLIDFNLATALERAGGEPDGRCEAHRIYQRLSQAASDGDIAQAARVALQRMDGACAPLPPPAADLAIVDDEPITPSAERPAPPVITEAPGEASLSLSAGLLIGAGIAAVAMGGTYIGALYADEDRSRALERVLAARDDSTRERAITEWEVARDRTDALGYTSIALGVVAACLGGAAWLVSDEASPSVSVGPGGASARFSF